MPTLTITYGPDLEPAEFAYQLSLIPKLIAAGWLWGGVGEFRWDLAPTEIPR
jgi:hypothetical protein